MTDLSEIIQNKFRGKKIVIAGDLVADQFLRGTIARVSREAPVFILRHDETETLGGAAANAAVNIASLGAKPALVGVIGRDANGELLSEALEKAKVSCQSVVAADGFRTVTKIRVLAGQHYAQRQQVIRIDYENNSELGDDLRSALLERLNREAADAHAVIISDYNYGVANQDLMHAARTAAKDRGIPLIVDSRFRLSEFPDALSATPNQEEVEKLLGTAMSDELCEQLRQDLGYQALLVTRGNEGMLLAEQNRPPVHIEAIGSKQPVDVTGAGDTVIAVYALGLASGLSFFEAATVANHAGGIVVMKKGTASVTPDELLASMKAIIPAAEPAGSPR